MTFWSVFFHHVKVSLVSPIADDVSTNRVVVLLGSKTYRNLDPHMAR